MRKYPTIYPVLDLKAKTVVQIFNSLEEAREYVHKQTSFYQGKVSVLMKETKHNLMDFSLKQLTELHDYIVPPGEELKRGFRKKSSAVPSIMHKLGHPKQEKPSGSKPLETRPRIIETEAIPSSTRARRKKKKPRIEMKKRKKVTQKRGSRMRFKLAPKVTITNVELETTGESYRLDIEKNAFSARYFYHLFITEGLDKEAVLRKVKHYTGREQNPNYYVMYQTELERMGALKEVKNVKTH